VPCADASLREPPAGAPRARLAAVALAALAIALAVGAATASAEEPAVHFPRDHLAHPATGIEWWYVTGVVRGSDGRRYSIFYTLFRRSGFVLPVSQVIDLGSGARVGRSERLAPATLGTQALDVSAAGARLRYEPGSNRWSFGASGPGYALSIEATPAKPYALHGGDGVIGQSDAGRSFYYSSTRMRATGTIVHGARRIAFTGDAWFDHQWGNFENDDRAFNWDWFSCRFDDRTELMLYRFRDAHGRPLTAYASGTFVSRSGRAVPLHAFTVAAGRRVLAASGRRWPLDWQLRVPAEHLSLSLRSIVRDQLFHGTVVPTFWEGAATVQTGKPGLCFVEQSYR